MMRTTSFMTLAALLFLFVGSVTLADGLKDNLPSQVRPVPPLGIEVSKDDRAQLMAGIAQLDDAIAKLRVRPDARTQNLLPDVQIFLRAVRQGVEYRELVSTRDVENAKKVLSC